MIAEALKQNVPAYVISISEKVGIGKVIYVNSLNDWQNVKSEFDTI